MLTSNIEKLFYFFSTNLKELDNRKTITYKLKFIDRFRFISSKLSDLVVNLSEICSKNSRDKSCESECEFKGLKDNNLSHKCKEYIKIQPNEIFFNIY